MNALANFFVGVIVPFSTVIPLFAGLLFFKQADRSIRLVLAFLAVSLLTNTAASILASNGQNNLPLLHLYTLIEGTLLLLFFSHCILSAGGKRLCRMFLGIFPVLCLADVLFFHSIYQYNSYSRPVEAIFLVVMAMMYLSEQIGRERKTGIEKARFWIVIGLLAYFSVAFFQFLFSNLLSATTSKEIILRMWDLHACFVLLMYILIAIGLTKLKHDR